jgi:hypothetical protein
MIRKPFKVRILTALALGELTQRQLAMMLSTGVRTIEQELVIARKHGYVRTARFEIVRRRRPQGAIHIAHYALTLQGQSAARRLLCQS